MSSPRPSLVDRSAEVLLWIHLMDATISSTSLAMMPTTMPKFASKIAKNIVGYAVVRKQNTVKQRHNAPETGLEEPHAAPRKTGRIGSLRESFTMIASRSWSSCSEARRGSCYPRWDLCNLWRWADVDAQPEWEVLRAVAPVFVLVERGDHGARLNIQRCHRDLQCGSSRLVPLDRLSSVPGEPDPHRPVSIVIGPAGASSATSREGFQYPLSRWRQRNVQPTARWAVLVRDHPKRLELPSFLRYTDPQVALPGPASVKGIECRDASSGEMGFIYDTSNWMIVLEIDVCPDTEEGKVGGFDYIAGQ
ncbi:hypothetical protein B0H14DRAFT_2598163 [Mycena olivaceomarginata]|nr:hypothetical protein B0H14DRAFT_2598163 [Mycena olivaceomarginata]